jgi:hypothetical protein
MQEGGKSLLFEKMRIFFFFTVLSFLNPMVVMVMVRIIFYFYDHVTQLPSELFRRKYIEKATWINKNLLSLTNWQNGDSIRPSWGYAAKFSQCHGGGKFGMVACLTTGVCVLASTI